MDQKKGTEEVISELKKIIEEELGELDKWDDYAQAFQPLTDGLGLESPRKKETVFSPPPAAQAAPAPSASEEKLEQVKRIQEKVLEIRARVDKDADQPEQVVLSPESAAVPPATFAAVMQEPPAKEATPLEVPEALRILPPPGKSPSIFRRTCAALIDQAFVLTLLAIALLITLKIQTGTFTGEGTAFETMLEEPKFIRYAVLEFTAIWLAYLMFCIGVLDMTFGMWVWGIRVGYMTKSKRTWVVRKVLRTVLSFVFYAPVLPLVFLMIAGKRGRTLLEALSGTMVYQSVVTE